jgi:hypothetical protein
MLSVIILNVVMLIVLLKLKNYDGYSVPISFINSTLREDS